jgi:hypothetical protein
MAIGAIGMLGGGVALLAAAYDFDAATALRGAGAAGPPALVALAAVTVTAGFSFVRALVQREQSCRSPDPPSIALVSIITLGMAGFAIGGYVSAHPPDKRFLDPAVPYTFTYPGQWERDPQADLPKDPRMGYMVGVSKQVRTTVNEGVLVYAFTPPSGSSWMDSMRDPGQTGAHVAREKHRTVGGLPAVKVELERDPGVLEYSRTVVLNRRTAFVIDCIMTKHTRGEAGRAASRCSTAFDSPPSCGRRPSIPFCGPSRTATASGLDTEAFHR